jgi:hypothetical protein
MPEVTPGQAAGIDRRRSSQRLLAVMIAVALAAVIVAPMSQGRLWSGGRLEHKFDTARRC